MNEMFRHRVTETDLRRRAQIFAILEEICHELEPTEGQFQRLQQAYDAVGAWLAGADDPLLVAIIVYLQGSIALGTAIRPIGRREIDADLIAFAAGVSTSVSPGTLKRVIGDRLSEHNTYANILEEKKRCWRLNYAGDFHLDISPTIANPSCPSGGELVPDRELRRWHPTNPQAYKAVFDKRAAMQPHLVYSKVGMRQEFSTVEPFPVRETIKGILRRLIQLLKRHRDQHFLAVRDEVAPISIIITTLAMWAYEYCVRRHVFDDEIDVLVETIRMMPHFIQRPIMGGKQIYAIWNETTNGENFADRWNTEPERVVAFYQWHAKALADFEAIRDAVGLDTLTLKMQTALGERVVKKVVGERTQLISDARKKGTLLVTPSIGLSVTPAAASTVVPKNDFFGD